jgi:(hydroxyamino)benzene mutase
LTRCYGNYKVLGSDFGCEDSELVRAACGQFSARDPYLIGVALLVFSSMEGFAIPYFASPRLGPSAHTLSALEGVLLLALGLVWLKTLNLGVTMSRIAFWLLVYSALAILAAYVLAALWGAGNEIMPLAAGTAHGSAFQENVIKLVAYSSAPTGLISFALIWGEPLH